MKKYWKKFLKFLYEMIPVMVGVYLAFALNTFSENRKLKAHQSNFEEMIKKEIIENQKSIDFCLFRTFSEEEKK